MIVSFIMFFLGLNKQLDFQVLLIEIGKPVAIKGGWYESRRIVQAVFAFFIIGLSGLFAGLFIHLIRQHWRYHIPALLGLAILCLYVIIETVSISHVAFNLEPYEKWGMRLTDLIEMAGILLIIANALRHIKKND